LFGSCWKQVSNLKVFFFSLARGCLSLNTVGSRPCKFLISFRNITVALFVKVLSAVGPHNDMVDVPHHIGEGLPRFSSSFHPLGVMTHQDSRQSHPGRNQSPTGRPPYLLRIQRPLTDCMYEAPLQRLLAQRILFKRKSYVRTSVFALHSCWQN
jgi:hypothetical protein